MRTKDAAEFDRLYFDEICKDPVASKYACYLRAEAEYTRTTARRKYSSYESFRKCFCIRNKKRNKK